MTTHTAILGIAILSLFQVHAARGDTSHPAYRPTLNPVRFDETPAHDAIALVQNGEAQATIVVAEDVFKIPKSVPMRAAAELNSHLKLATGVALPIVADSNTPSTGTVVLLGYSALTKRLGLDPEGLEAEGFVVKSFQQGELSGIAIIGDSRDQKISTTRPGTASSLPNRGTLFGVYDVLERFLGVRWYYPGPDGRVVPETSDWEMAAVAYRDWPVSTKRTFYPWQILKPQIPGVTSQFEHYQHAWRSRDGGSAQPYTTPCHSPIFQNHFEEYPECYELGGDGRRNPTMPCYGNPETVDLMVQDVVNFYEKGDKSAWQRKDGSYWYPPTDKVICISPPDKGVMCYCEECRALMEPDAIRLGRASRVMANFIVNFSKRIEELYPDKNVWYLPYSNYTIATEGLELPDNVIVGLCLMRGAANGKDPRCAAEHDRWISEWSEASSNPLHLWEYACWPMDDTTLPFQYRHVLQDFQQKYKGKLAGSFINGGGAPADLPGRVWAMHAPTYYCWFRLFWNPDFDVDAAWGEYVDLMYGPAKEPMGELLDLLTTRWEEVQWTTPPNGHHISPAQIHEQTMPAEEAAKLEAWLAEARTLAGEDTLWRRRVDFIGNAVDMFMVESENYHSPKGLPALTILKVGGDPTIDGKLTDLAWKDSQWQSFVRAKDRQEPIAASRVAAVWTMRGVTFAFDLEEPRMDRLRVAHDAHDTATHLDDCLELFLDVASERLSYYQFMINANGIVADRFSQTGLEWDAAGINVATDLRDDSWSMEVFIPFAAFDALEIPSPGDLWYGNFTRHRVPAESASEKWQRWSSLGRSSNHDMTAFGQLRFVE